VNGLQTSTQISYYFNDDGKDAPNRSVMVKIVSSEDEVIRDKIIKATNSQNPVQPATLRATDKIQRDIEATLKSVGLYYDRRKNFYKNEGRPADKIVSIPLMAQILMSLVLGRPDDARARPSSLIKDDSIYKQLFSQDLPIALYVFSARLIKRIDHMMRSMDNLTSRDKNNVRFYAAVFAVWKHLKKSDPTAAQISGIDFADMSDAYLNDSINTVYSLYNKLGASDQVSKGQELKKSLRTEVLLMDL